MRSIDLIDNIYIIYKVYDEKRVGIKDGPHRQIGTLRGRNAAALAPSRGPRARGDPRAKRQVGNGGSAYHSPLASGCACCTYGWLGARPVYLTASYRVCVSDRGVGRRRAVSSRYLCYEIATARGIRRAVPSRDTGTPIGVDEPRGLTSGLRCWREPHVHTSVILCHLACVARERARERRRGRERERAYVVGASAASILATRKRRKRRKKRTRGGESSRCRCYVNSRSNGFTSPRTSGTTTRCTTARLPTRYSRTTSECREIQRRYNGGTWVSIVPAVSQIPLDLVRDLRRDCQRGVSHRRAATAFAREHRCVEAIVYPRKLADRPALPRK